MELPVSIKKALASAILTFLFFTVVLNFVYIPTGSMEPSIRAGSLCISLRLPYILKRNIRVSRGDIIVFRSKEKGKMLCKRIVGLPGETVSFTEGTVFINGGALEEPYTAEEKSSYANKTFIIPDRCVFVLGDNRLHSSDSRVLLNPYIQFEDIHSRIIAVFALPALRRAGRTGDSEIIW